MPVNNAQAVGGGNDAMQGIMQLLQLAGGLTSSTQKSTADTSAIDAVLKQLQGQDFSGILNSVFQQASAKTPQLTTQLANAVGARTGNNSPLAAALQQVLQAATVQGQGQIAQQQAQNLQTQAALAGQKAQATRTVQTKENTASNGAKQLLAGLQLGNTASKMYNKKSLYDNAKDLFGGGGDGSSAVAPLGGGGSMLGTTSSPVAAMPGTQGTAFDPANYANAFSTSQTMPEIPSGGGVDTSGLGNIDLNFGSTAGDAAASLGSNVSPDLASGVANGIDYSELTKNTGLDNLDLSFSSDAATGAASGASTASGSAAAAGSSVGSTAASALPYLAYANAALNFNENRKQIGHTLASGDASWVDKVATVAPYAALINPWLALAGPVADAADSFMTSADDNKLNPILGNTRALRSVQDKMDNKWNPGKKFFNDNGIPQPSAISGLSTATSINDFVSTAVKNPGEALSHTADNVNEFISNIDDGAHNLVNGISHGVQNVANNIGDAIASVFGW